MTHGIFVLQKWVAAHAGSKSFELSEPLVTVVHTSHPADWYGSHENVDAYNGSFQNNVVSEAFGALRMGFDTPRLVALAYIDAEPPCGEKYGGAAVEGGAGVAVLPANDLRGLTSETTVPTCGQASEQQYPVSRWIGGMGHELGHALGLPHPPGCDQGLPDCDTGALMGQGYLTFPDTYLRLDELDVLKKNPLFGSWALADPTAE